MSKYEFDSILELLKSETQHNEIEIKKLVSHLSMKFSEDKVVKVVHWLLDNNKMVQTQLGFIKWVK